MKHIEASLTKTVNGRSVVSLGMIAERTSARHFAVLAACVLLWAAQALQACTIPVFRYALDRWTSDSYQLEVSPADAKDEAVAKFLRNLGTSSPYNLKGERLEPANQGPSRLLFPPDKQGDRTVAWSGSLNADLLEQLVQSSARRQVVDAIAGGASTVWIYVESGDKSADDAAVAKLEKRMRYLEQVAQLPHIDPNDPTSTLGPGPKLQVKLPLLRVSKADASETPFLKMLAGSKGTEELTKGAWLAAIFGRGRVLGAWPAKGFGDEQVEEVCMFLMGACSCQVKNLNPGWDILMSVDWDAELQKAAKMAAVNDVTAVTPPPEKTAEPETVVIKADEPKVLPKAPPLATVIAQENEEEAASAGPTTVNWALIGGVGVLLVAGICFWFGAQSRR